MFISWSMVLVQWKVRVFYTSVLVETPDETTVCSWSMADMIVCNVNSYSASRDKWCTVGGDGGCKVSEVRAGTTSPMPDHKGFKLQLLVNFQKFSTLRVNSYCSLRIPPKQRVSILHVKSRSTCTRSTYVQLPSGLLILVWYYISR